VGGGELTFYQCIALGAQRFLARLVGVGSLCAPGASIGAARRVELARHGARDGRR
jgi:hypothetical protein